MGFTAGWRHCQGMISVLGLIVILNWTKKLCCVFVQMGFYYISCSFAGVKGKAAVEPLEDQKVQQ